MLKIITVPACQKEVQFYIQDHSTPSKLEIDNYPYPSPSTTYDYPLPDGAQPYGHVNSVTQQSRSTPKSVKLNVYDNSVSDTTVSCDKVKYVSIVDDAPDNEMYESLSLEEMSKPQSTVSTDNLKPGEMSPQAVKENQNADGKKNLEMRTSKNRENSQWKRFSNRFSPGSISGSKNYPQAANTPNRLSQWINSPGPGMKMFRAFRQPWMKQT